MVASTVERVPLHTCECDNERIRVATEQQVFCTAAGGKDAIDRRIAELDHEWDIERAIEAQAASVVLLSSLLGLTVNRKWFAFPVVVGGFLLQHVIQGWCPPVPVLRRLGFRTQSEIERERYALKSLRGDFREVPEADDREAVAAAIRAVDR